MSKIGLPGRQREAGRKREREKCWHKKYKGRAEHYLIWLSKLSCSLYRDSLC